MNPFDLPPASPPVSTAPPSVGPSSSGRPGGRGRTAAIAVSAAALVGAGLVGISQFASADRPELGDAAGATPGTDPGDDSTEPIDPVPADEPADIGDPADDGDQPAVDGQIVIDDGDGEPIVIDLGEVTIDGAPLSELADCIGLPFLEGGPMLELPTEFPIDRFDQMGDLPLGDLSVPGSDGTHVTVLGPDGVSIIDLGDGDGSVTIAQSDGEVEITTEGDATVQQMSDLIGELGDLGDRFENLDPQEIFDEFFADGLPDGFPRFEDGFDLEPRDPAEIESCLDDLRGG